MYDQTSFKNMVKSSQNNHVMFSVGTDFFPHSTNNFMTQNSLNNYDVMVGNAFPLNSRFNGSVMNNVNFPMPNTYNTFFQVESEDTRNVPGSTMHIADL